MISAARMRLEEDVPALDVVLFARAGLLLPGDRTWKWEGTGGGVQLRVIALGDVVEIRAGWGTLGELTLGWSECNYGGRRPWWLCPRCESRRRKLYLLRGALRCRLCADVGYGCKLEREPVRGLRRARKAREKLGGRPALVDPFPRRPARMRWSTYAALREQALSAERAYLLSIAEATAEARRSTAALIAAADSRQ